MGFEWFFDPSVDVPQSEVNDVASNSWFGTPTGAGMPNVDTGGPSIASMFSPSLVDAAAPGIAGTPANLGQMSFDPVSGQFFRQGNELFYDPNSGHIVNPSGQPIIDKATVSLLADLASGKVAPTEPGLMDRLMAGLKPAEQFLGTNLGKVLATLGLGAAGLGLGQLVAGNQPAFKPPALNGPSSPALNPAAIALENEIRMNGLRRLRDAGLDTTGAGDPITAQLVERLNKAFRGETSNPVLQRAYAQENEKLNNEIAQKYGRGGGESSGALERRSRQAESQSVRDYLDNTQTINTLAPMQGQRVQASIAQGADLSGINTAGGQRQFYDDLATRLAYNNYLQDAQSRSSLARGIAGLFGQAAGIGLGGTRPWDRPSIVVAG